MICIYYCSYSPNVSLNIIIIIETAIDYGIGEYIRYDGNQYTIGTFDSTIKLMK